MKHSWTTVTLEEVCEFQDRRGLTPEKLDSQFISAGFRVISAKNIKRRQIDIAIGEQRFVDEPTYRKWMKFPLAPDDVLLTSEAPLGEPAYVSEQLRWCLGQRLFGITTDKSKLYGKFLFYALQASPVRDDLLSRATGATAQGIRQAELRRVMLPLPSLPVQHRIVGILDAALKHIDTVKANAAKNLKNVRTLFENLLQSVFSKRGDDWKTERLGHHVEFKNGLNFTRQSKGQTLRMIGVGDFHDNLMAPVEGIQSVTIDGTLSDDYLVRRDDLLVVRSNGSKELVGRCMLVPDVDEATSYSGFIIRLRFDTRKINPRFLLRYMKSSKTRDRLIQDGGGTNISNINQAKLSELPISLPPLKEQEIIANRLDELFIETQRLAALYRSKLDALNALKKSLLNHAFSGQL